MSDRIGWLFPPTGGGVAAGFNDPGLAHFGGAREQSLARETIQNSLDASARLGQPVEVEFELQEPAGDWFRKDELATTIEACRVVAEGDEKAVSAFEAMGRLLNGASLTFLRVADRNTTGLAGRNWRALVKESGTSWHDRAAGRTAGGSWGIGKNAPFTVSPLRTVFYWTRFEEDGEPHELFQGKSVLMSHGSNGEERQGTGFFGLTDGCEALKDDAVPAAIRSVEGDRTGTSLWIAGFPKQDGWQERIARRVVASFFGAIADGELSVSLETGADAERDITVIDADSLDGWFERLTGERRDADSEPDDVEEARLFRDMLTADEPAEREIAGIGLCRLWIRVADADERLPSKVGLMRRTGMLITTEQSGHDGGAGLQRFPGLRPFIALCRFEAEEGNALLRDMENARHDQFELDHIEDPKRRQQASRALRRVIDWIRGEIRERAAPPVSAEPTPLSELSRLLPDLEPAEDSFGDGGDGENEPSFGGAPVVRRLKPVRLGPRRVGGQERGGADWDEMNEERSEPSDNGGGGIPVDPPAPPRRRRLPIRDARITPAPGGGRWSVAFTPDEDGEARVVLAEAGDSAIFARSDIRAFKDGAPIPLDEPMPFEKDRRVTFEIEADGPIGGRAWLVSAEKVERAERPQ